MGRIKTTRSAEAAAHGNALLYAEAWKGLRDLEGAGNADFGNTVGLQARDIPAVKLNLAFVGIKAGDQVENSGFASPVGPGNTVNLTLFYFKAEVVDCGELADIFG